MLSHHLALRCIRIAISTVDIYCNDMPTSTFQENIITIEPESNDSASHPVLVVRSCYNRCFSFVKKLNKSNQLLWFMYISKSTSKFIDKLLEIIH